jgi:hypothetical protein
MFSDANAAFKSVTWNGEMTVWVIFEAGFKVARQ